MPTGIVATVDDGFATLDFVDTRLRGPGLQKLLDIGGPETIQTITRRGPRRQYKVPEGNAREAGLLDDQTRPPRGLNADGTPDNSAQTGAGGFSGVTDSGVVDVGAGDTGPSLALKNADPNDGTSITGADGPAAGGAVDWHTPVSAYTSANKFVGKVPNANVLHNRSQVVTGTGTSVGSDLVHPLSHADLIAYVKENSVGFQRTEGTREPVTPAAVVSNALGSQPAALGSDPGGFAPQPGEAPRHVELNRPSAGPGTFSGPQAPVVAENRPTGTDGRPAGIPDGEPHEDWKRAELNAYAAWKGFKAPEALATKAQVLAAINSEGQ